MFSKFAAKNMDGKLLKTVFSWSKVFLDLNYVENENLTRLKQGGVIYQQMQCFIM